MLMCLQGLRPAAMLPLLPSCASERDHFEIIKYIAKGVGSKTFRG